MCSILQNAKGMNLSWTYKYKAAFQELKDYLGQALLLSKSRNGENLFLYLVVSEVAVSGVLIRLEEGKELHVYYVSKALLDLETRYSNAEKI